MDIPEIELTESITGERIMPPEPTDEWRLADPYEPVCDTCHGDGIVRIYTGRAGQQTQPCPRCVMEGRTR